MHAIALLYQREEEQQNNIISSLVSHENPLLLPVLVLLAPTVCGSWLAAY